MDGVVAINGDFFPLSEAKIPATDRGFLFGDSIFETMVAFGPKILELSRHIERLHASAEKTKIPLPCSDEILRFEIESLAEYVGYLKGSIRLIISRGLGISTFSSDDLESQRYAIATPVKNTDPKPFRLKIFESQIEPGAHAKKTNYAAAILAQKEARSQSYDDILWVNQGSELTESSIANIFLIARQGELVEIATPHPSSGILLGLTRQRMIELLQSAQIRVTERVIFLDEVARFDEAFLCSSVRGLVPIEQINQHKLKTTRSESVFSHIQRLFNTWVHVEIGYPVNWHTGEKI